MPSYSKPIYMSAVYRVNGSSSCSTLFLSLMSILANSVQPFSLILVFRITVIRYLNHVVENPKLSIQQWHPLGLKITRSWVISIPSHSPSSIQLFNAWVPSTTTLSVSSSLLSWGDTKASFFCSLGRDVSWMSTNIQRREFTFAMYTQIP